MAVTIEQMDVDVQPAAQPAEVSPAPPAAKARPELRLELQLLAERMLRLKAD